MKLISLLSLMLVSFLVLIKESNAAEKVTVEAHGSITAPEFIPSSELEEEEETEQHVRVERSPGWRRRFRVRVRKPIRKIGRAVRKTVKKVKHGVKTVGRKIGKGVKKAVSKVKSGVKKLAAKTKAAIKKAGSKLRGAVKKAKEKIKSNVRRLKSKIKKVVRVPGDLAKKLRDKLMSLNKKEEEEEEEEVIIEPEVNPTDATIFTNPPRVTKPVCNSACQFIRNAAKEAEFFKQSFCAFYTVRRQHRDFLIDRNFNVTLEYILNDVMRESLNFYSTLAEILQAEVSKITLESREKVSSDCARGKLMTCSSTGVDKAVRKLMCLIPCSGFSGCNQSDKGLQTAIDQAVEAYVKATNRTLKLLE